MPKLFIAVTSHQNVANFPPILAMAQHGDVVVWVVSVEMARQYDWAKEVLEKRGLQVEEHKISDAYTLAELNVRELVNKFPNDQYEWYIIGNGGTKPGMLQLVLSIAQTRCPHHLIYGSDKPVTMLTIDAGSVIQTPYGDGQPLDIEDILALSGHTIGPRNGDQVWPSNHGFSCHGYGVDSNLTVELHRRRHEWFKTRCITDDKEISIGNLPTFSQIAKIYNPKNVVLSRRYDSWLKTLSSFNDAGRDVAGNLNDISQIVSDVYNSTRKLIWSGRIATLNLGCPNRPKSCIRNMDPATCLNCII
ncbi:MAG: hypothetical protein HQL80_03255 [Magnetococcales bacterium]|nr:hypothetical protein [Magnetococcales bacterium]